MHVEGLEHHGERDVVAAGIDELDRLLFTQEREKRVVGGLLHTMLARELMHKIVDNLFVAFFETRALAAPQGRNDLFRHAFGPREIGVRRPFMPRLPMNGNDEDRKLEQALLELRTKPQSLADRRPMLADSW